MSSDLSHRLKAAGPVQVPPLVLEQVQARASRWRLRRFVIVAAAATLLIAGGVATWAAVDLNGSVPTRPAGPDASACPPSNYDIALFLEDDTTASELEALQRQVGRLEKVESVAYFSVEAAFEEFKNHYEDQPEFWINLPEDALPASLRLTVTADATDADIARVIRDARGLAGIDGVRRGLAEDGCPELNRSDDVSEVRVPRLVGRTYRRACLLVEGKLLLRVRDQAPGLCGDDSVVVTQNPPPRAAVRAGTTVTVTLSPAKDLPLSETFPLDELIMKLRLERDRIAPGRGVGSTFIVRNETGEAIIDRNCALLSVRFGIVKSPNAQLYQAIVGNCGEPRRILPGTKLVLRGPRFTATSSSGEPLAPGQYLAVVKMEGRSERLIAPVEVTAE